VRREVIGQEVVRFHAAPFIANTLPKHACGAIYGVEL